MNFHLVCLSNQLPKEALSIEKLGPDKWKFHFLPSSWLWGRFTGAHVTYCILLPTAISSMCFPQQPHIIWVWGEYRRLPDEIASCVECRTPSQRLNRARVCWDGENLSRLGKGEPRSHLIERSYTNQSSNSQTLFRDPHRGWLRITFGGSFAIHWIYLDLPLLTAFSQWMRMWPDQQGTWWPGARNWIIVYMCGDRQQDGSDRFVLTSSEAVPVCGGRGRGVQQPATMPWSTMCQPANELYGNYF